MTEKQIVKLLGICKDQLYEVQNLLTDSKEDKHIQEMLNRIKLYIRDIEFSISIILRNPTSSQEDYLEVNQIMSEMSDFISRQSVSILDARVFVVITSLNSILNSVILSFPYLMLKRFKKKMSQESIDELMNLMVMLGVSYSRDTEITKDTRFSTIENSPNYKDIDNQSVAVTNKQLSKLIKKNLV